MNKDKLNKMSSKVCSLFDVHNLEEEEGLLVLEMVKYELIKLIKNE